MLHETISQRIENIFHLKETTAQRSARHNATKRQNNLRYARRNNKSTSQYAAREINLPIIPQICLTELPEKIYEAQTKRRTKKKRQVKFEDVRKRKTSTTKRGTPIESSDPIQVVQSVREKFKEDSDDEGDYVKKSEEAVKKVTSLEEIRTFSVSNKSLLNASWREYEETRSDFEAQFNGEPVSCSTETLTSSVVKRDIEVQFNSEVEIGDFSSDDTSTIQIGNNVESISSFKSLKQTCSSFMLLKDLREPEIQQKYPENESKIGDQPELPAFMQRLSNILEHIENVLKEQT